MKKILLLFLFVLGCTSPSKKDFSSEKLLFPDGRYVQDVDVHVKAKDYQNNFDFNCVIKKSPGHFLFVGYNMFGLTLFKIKEENNKIEMESSVEQINQRKEFFLKVFDLVKTILSLEKSDPRLKNEVVELEFQERKSRVSVSEYNKSGVPTKMTVETPGLYSIQIKTTQFVP